MAKKLYRPKASSDGNCCKFMPMATFRNSTLVSVVRRHIGPVCMGEITELNIDDWQPDVWPPAKPVDLKSTLRKEVFVVDAAENGDPIRPSDKRQSRSKTNRR